MRNKIIPTIALISIVIAGFWFRLYGILDNHSFWADEAGASSFARNIVTGKLPLLRGLMAITYEPLHIGITAIFFSVFGFNEFAARLPYVLLGTVGIVFAYLLGKRLSNTTGGLISSFMFSFSQLNLANSTQAKPYAAVETLLLVILYLLTYINNTKIKSTEEKHNPFLTSAISIHFLIIISLITATLIHAIASMFWIIYIIYCTLMYFKLFSKLFFKPIFLVSFITLCTLLFYVVSFNRVFFNIFTMQNGKFFFLSNNTKYIKHLLLNEYAIFLLPAIFALYYSYKKYRYITIGLVVWIAILLLMWNFRSYSHNIRYLVPFFGVMFVFFGVFWGKIGEQLSIKLKNNSIKLIPFVVIAVLYISGYKIVRLPQTYYSPNADFYGDVQIANYKSMFDSIKKNVPNYKNIAIYNSIPDAEIWYFTEKRSNAYFMKGTEKPFLHQLYKVMIYGNLHNFLVEKSKYPKGILIVEDWESYLPEDIKQYAKKNMKLEFRIDSLAQAKDDPWPLEVYSWGIH